MIELKKELVADVKAIREKIFPAWMNVKRTITQYKTKFWTPVILYSFYIWGERAWNYFDYGYARVLKDYIHNKFYTDYEWFIKW